MKALMKKITLAILGLLVITACSREDVLKTAGAIGASYNTSYRDSVIENWQAKVVDKPVCAQFRMRFKVAGEQYDSAANGPFQTDMLKIWTDTKAAGCGTA